MGKTPFGFVRRRLSIAQVRWGACFGMVPDQEEMIAMARRPSLDKDAIVRRILSLIEQEQLLPGETIGTERDLSARLGIPRSALRAALKIMERDRRIIRRIGRNGGVIVADGKLVRNLDTIESLPEIARRQGFLLESRVEESRTAAATPGEARRLRIGDADPVVRICRLRFLDGEPFCLERTILPSELFPKLLMDDSYAESLYGTFRSRYGIDVVSSDESLDCVPADDGTASRLGQPEGAPLFRIRRVSTDASGRAVEESEDLFVSSKIRFAMHPVGYVRLSATTQTWRRNGDDKIGTRRSRLSFHDSEYVASSMRLDLW